MADDIKDFYRSYHDRIGDKRFDSPYWLRRYVHRRIHEQFLAYIRPGQRVLDAGCGDGILSCMLARQGARVVGLEISTPNIEAARRRARVENLDVHFVQGDVERLPFGDDSFDVVVSSHVLEHLEAPLPGLREVRRVTRDAAIIAMPTCLNPACWALLGRDNYWKLGRRSPVAMVVGLFRTAVAYIRREEGPNEGYGGDRSLPHVWRFPSVMRRQIERAGLRIARFEAGPLIVPYLAHYFPPARWLQPEIERLRAVPVIRDLGYGSMAVCRKATAVVGRAAEVNLTPEGG